VAPPPPRPVPPAPRIGGNDPVNLVPSFLTSFRFAWLALIFSKSALLLRGRQMQLREGGGEEWVMGVEDSR